MSTSSVIVATPNATTLLNINMTNVTKLTATNFLMWKRQVLAIFDGYDLAGYLDGSTLAPDAVITTAGTESPNPAYKHWKRQDQLNYAALIGAISASVQPLLSKATTTAAIWSTLHDTYANPSRSHIKVLRDQLKHWKKGTKSIEEYFQGLTIRFDELALLESPIPHEDQIDYILGGLPEDYKQVCDQIEGRERPPSLTEIHEKLINQELKIQTQLTASSSVPITANAASYKNNNNNNNANNGNRNQNRSRGNQPARRCLQLQASGSGYPSSGGGYPSSPFTPWQPHGNVATAQPYNNPWVFDTGATHHLTSDLANLSLHQPYNGGEEVTIADGSGLPITHTGSGLFPTPTRSLALRDILYVPDILKNLISVYRLCNTNGVSVEFFPAHFQVKDLSTGVQLLQGRTKNELYEWPVNRNNINAFAASPSPKTDLSSWHLRLGHPSLPILNTVVSQFSLPLSNSQQKQWSCFDCLINKSHKLPFYSNTITSTQPLENLYTDVWSSPIISTDNFKYYLVIVDHFTRYTWLYPLKQKSQVKEVFVAFKALVENRFQCKIRTLYSDNGGEFVALRSFLATHGISHLTTPPHMPEHNGISERKHRHIVETGVTLLSHASIPKISYYIAPCAVLHQQVQPPPPLPPTSPMVPSPPSHQHSSPPALPQSSTSPPMSDPIATDQYGIDYSETFSPVIKSTTIRLVLEVAVKRDWRIHQVDINNAFLQGTLQEVVYVSQPPGFIDRDRPTHVCRLNKALYGLKQALRAWYQELRNFLLAAGFTNSLSHTSLFIYKRGNAFLYVLVYVDDIIIAGDDLLVRNFNVSLADRFSLKDLGPLSYFLDIEAIHADWANDLGDCLSANAYIVYFGGSPISWSSKKQRSVSRSSTEAEYRAVANTASELQWICSLLLEMGISLPSTPVVYCDNMGANYLCANPVFHSRMKHVALDYHFVRGNIQSGALRVAHV
ncbi:Reverse transcriptase RNA-dependent DNA polymerase [Arabidopsis thaliana x Arabidopsis arenosa]|uniref:Reverse transcriptase RNA-dependent DNA polymerase n=1 Tax=Arabidopsis thaliana x Arabidopsis arenosa TaxID=1240361 RepID=A0A8T1XFT6_9BRAS|nr:Reverse transcriptase RNA-dependent DNA polymerase [Arabidopsis thaliana x Arabidopsis arenosa]